MENIVVIGGGHITLKDGNLEGKLKGSIPNSRSLMRAKAAAQIATTIVNRNKVYRDKNPARFYFMEGMDDEEHSGGEAMYQAFKSLVRETVTGNFSYDELIEPYCRVERRPQRNNSRNFGSHTSLGNILMIDYLWADELKESRERGDNITIITNNFHMPRAKIIARNITKLNICGESAEDILKTSEDIFREQNQVPKDNATPISAKTLAREAIAYVLVSSNMTFKGLYIPRDLKKESDEVNTAYESLRSKGMI